MRTESPDSSTLLASYATYSDVTVEARATLTDWVRDYGIVVRALDLQENRVGDGYMCRVNTRDATTAELDVYDFGDVNNHVEAASANFAFAAGAFFVVRATAIGNSVACEIFDDAGVRLADVSWTSEATDAGAVGVWTSWDDAGNHYVSYLDVAPLVPTTTPTGAPSPEPSATPAAPASTIAFVEHAVTSSAPFAISAHAADLDQDGDVDVLAASHDDDVIAWFEQDGSESFSRRVISAEAAAGLSVSAVDLDGLRARAKEATAGASTPPA